VPLTTDALSVTGNITCKEDGISAQTRGTILKQNPNVRFPVPLTSLRVWDAMQTNLPGTAATDDLAIIGGTFGSAPPLIQAGDCKAAGAVTRYARFEVPVPECYDAAETLSFILSAGMKTTIADTSCTIDLQVYELDKISGISADLCVTAAMTMNSLVFGDKTFSITPTTLAAGDMLDVRVAITCTDAATATAVTPTIAAIDLVCDIKG